MLTKTTRVVQLSVDCIDPSPYQARTAFDPTEITALSESIRENGLLQPVTVRKAENGRYTLVAGERRLRACRQAGLTRIPAIIASYEENQAAALGLLENIQRAQLNPFDTARGIHEVMELWGCTQAEAARRLGLSQPALANKLRLLALDEEQERICLKFGLTERHARAALRLPSPQRTFALKEMGEKQLSVRHAERLVEGMLTPKGAPKLPMPLVRDVKLFYNTIEHAVRVMVHNGIPATASRMDGEDYIEYRVQIPKSAAVKSRK